MDIAPFFDQKTALKQQFDDPGAGGLGAQPVRCTEDLFQIFILHEARNPGHRRQQRGIGKMAWRLGLTFNHFALFTQQFIVFRHHRQRRAVVLFIPLFTAQQRSPARFGKESGLSDEFTLRDIQFNHAFTEYRIRAKLHQVLTGYQVIHLRFIVRQSDTVAARSRNNGVVSINLFIIPAAITGIGIYRRLRQQIRRMHADGVHYRMPSSEVLFRQIATVRTRIGNQLVGFIQLLADVEHVLRAQAKAFRRFNL